MKTPAIKSEKYKKAVSFREAVFKVVSEIPKGKILTYKEVAQLSGFPKAWRAVGNVLNKSPGVVKGVPCHRVIRSDKKIGGFNEGINKKILLLKKEGVIIKNHSFTKK